MNENQYRYKITQEGYEDALYSMGFEDAVEAAKNMLNTGERAPVVIADRRARKGKPSLYDVTHCTGEAHSNPYIDHCNVCMPRWGIVVRAKDIKAAQ